MKDKPVVCLVIHSLSLGGMERVMSEIANWLAAGNKAIVHIVLIGNKRVVEYELHKAIHIHKPNFTFKQSRRFVDSLRTMLFLRAKVKAINPLAVLSFGEYWNNLALLALWGRKAPVYISDRSQPDKNLGRLHNFLRDRLYPTAAGMIAQTRTAANIAEDRRWNKNVRVIHNPIRPVQVVENWADRPKNILTVGRLIRTKNIDQLIRIFLAARQPGWKLVIVGGNAKKQNLLEELRTLVRSLGAEEYVSIEGAQAQVDRYYNDSQIFAFTSSSEGYPNVLGEAMCAGLPVIAYDCIAGPSDMIDDRKNGFLIPLFDQDQFTEKLKLLMQDENLRRYLGKRALEKSRRFRTPILAGEYFDFFLGNLIQ